MIGRWQCVRCINGLLFLCLLSQYIKHADDADRLSLCCPCKSFFVVVSTLASAKDQGWCRAHAVWLHRTSPVRDKSDHALTRLITGLTFVQANHSRVYRWQGQRCDSHRWESPTTHKCTGIIHIDALVNKSSARCSAS
jgi:hypothetical protein